MNYSPCITDAVFLTAVVTHSLTHKRSRVQMPWEDYSQLVYHMNVVQCKIWDE